MPGIATVVVILAVRGILVINARRASAKRERLAAVNAGRGEDRQRRVFSRYGLTETCRKILNNEIWRGQSEEQLRDSLGAPEAIDRNVADIKTEVVWKYRHQGGNRYGLRVTLENGTVTGWDETT